MLKHTDASGKVDDTVPWVKACGNNDATNIPGDAKNYFNCERTNRYSNGVWNAYIKTDNGSTLFWQQAVAAKG